MPGIAGADGGAAGGGVAAGAAAGDVENAGCMAGGMTESGIE
jgi:hypothetical protein